MDIHRRRPAPRSLLSVQLLFVIEKGVCGVSGTRRDTCQESTTATAA